MTTMAEALHQAHTGKGLPKAGGRAPRPTSPCTVCVVIRHTENEDDRMALIEAAAGRISGRALHRALRSLDIGVSRDSINRHRNEAHRP